METKRNKKGRKQRPAQHHPWDEVSLPGAGTGPTEQPTILVLNQQVNVDAAAKRQEEQQKNNETATSAPTTPASDINVLDIESHKLIEDVNPYDALEASIGINELPPIDVELTEGTSKIETAANVRSIIEVEPAGAKTRQVVATDVPTQQATQAIAHQIKTQPTAADATAPQSVDAEAEFVRQTAEDLVNEIERQLIETLCAQQAATQKQQQQQQQAQENVAEVAATPTKTETNVEAAAQAELTSILKTKPNEVTINLPAEVVGSNASKPKLHSNELKIVEVPTPKTASEVEERKLFLESLPQIEQDKQRAGANEADAKRLSADCKREYYQSLKKYLLESSQEKPPVPLQTYRWEDLRRAKERGGYPWTHLYKRPLGPDEEPEIVLLLRKSQELRFTSESPKSLKKVRYDEQVLVKETERYIQDLSDDEIDEHDDITPQDSTEEDSTEVQHDRDEEHDEHAQTECQSLRSECISCVSDSVLAVGHSKPRKTNRLAHIRNIIKRRRSGRTHEDAQSLPGTSANTSRHSSVHDLAPPPGPLIPNTSKKPEHKSPQHCFPIMKKLKSLADRQKKRLNIRRISLKKDEKIVLAEETKILKLKSSPKCDRGEIPHFIEKQDSDDVLELVEYDESPSRKRNKDEYDDNEAPTTSSSIVQPDEVIELPTVESKAATEQTAQQNTDVEAVEAAETKQDDESEAPPKKAPRLRREHVYEEIATGQQLPEQQMTHIIDLSAVDELKKSLIRQDNLTVDDIELANKTIPLDRMGSSEEEQVSKSNSLLAPISSIDSTSSDEERLKLQQLSSVAEESDAASASEAEPAKELLAVEPNNNNNTNNASTDNNEQPELRPSIKKEASPAPSDKKVTFSHVEDEAEPHREDIELPEDVREAANNANKLKNIR